MKILLLVILTFVMVSSESAYSDKEIPISIRNDAEKMLQGEFRHIPMVSIIEDMAREKIFTNIINEDHKFYILPDFGKIILVKISGQLSDYGKTGYVLITIVKPDGSDEIVYAPLLETGKYLTYFPVDNSIQKGTYTVLAKFGSQTIPATYFQIGSDKINTHIPLWFGKNFQWWVDQKISDSEFVNSIQFLIDHKIIMIAIGDEFQHSNFQVFIQGEQMVRRGTTHTIISHVSDGINPIEGAKVTLRIEDYGEDVIREFEGFSNKDGDFIFSWEIPKSFDDLETLLAYISVTHGQSSKTTLFKFQVYCLPGESRCEIDGN